MGVNHKSLFCFLDPEGQRVHAGSVSRFRTETEYHKGTKGAMGAGFRAGRNCASNRRGVVKLFCQIAHWGEGALGSVGGADHAED